MFKKLTESKYILEPNKFNPDSIITNIELYDLNENPKLHLIFNTGIKADKQNEYKIVVYCGSRKFQMNGATIDTTLAATFDSTLRFEILLNDNHIKNQPSAYYHKLSTSNINIGNAKSVLINTSITRDYFYYLNPGIMNVEEEEGYYLINNKRIKKQ